MSTVMDPASKYGTLVLIAVIALASFRANAQDSVLEDAPATKLIGKELSVLVDDDIPLRAGKPSLSRLEREMHSCVFKGRASEDKTAHTIPARRNLVLALSRVELNAPASDEDAGDPKVSFSFDVRSGSRELASVTCDTVTLESVPTARDVKNALNQFLSIDPITSKTVIKTSEPHEISIMNPLHAH